MLGKRRRVVLLGIAFLALLILSYFENVLFFQSLNTLFQNQFLGLLMIFIHNITVISLILLGMTFYVNLVIQGFFKGQKHEDIVLKNPRIFAVVFTAMIVILSILRGSTLIFGEIVVEAIPEIVLASVPMGILEGYGIYLTIKKTLSRTLSLKGLVYIYGIFFIAALVELCFINLLT